MLRDFLNGIIELTQKTAELKVFDVPAEPRKQLLVQGVSREWVDRQPELRHAQLSSLASLLEYLIYESGTEEGVADGATAVFVCAQRIVALLDSTDRRETVSMLLTHTDLWKKLQELAAWRGYRPEQIVRELRALEAPASFVAAVRKLDFKRASGLQVSAEHGKESMGRQIEAAVQGAAEIPESFNVEASAFVQAGCRLKVTVRVEVYLNVQGECIELRVVPDQLLQLLDTVLADIEASIHAVKGCETLAVFMGTP